MKIFYTNYRKADVLLAICNMLFLISLVVCITVFFKQLYYFDISYLQIDKMSGLSKEVIKENYDVLIQYQSIFYQGTLQLPNFIMSEGGKIHFEEVKKIFEMIQILCVITGVFAIYFNYKRWKQKEYMGLRLTGIFTLVFPSVIGLLASIDFDRAFILFHKLFFQNDYWIFDARIDPVIQILPQTFFMHCFIMIIVLIIACSMLCLGCYRWKVKKHFE